MPSNSYSSPKSNRKRRKLLEIPIKGEQILAVILLLFWIVFLLGSFVLHGRYIFEGNLIVKEMSFTYSGEIEKLFLTEISSIKSLDIEGSQLQPLTLAGKFSSPSDPSLNQKLSKLNKLTIGLPYPISRLIFTPSNSTKNSELSILELRINSEIQVNQLAYNSQQNQLSFCLQASNTSLESCLFPESIPQSNLAAVGNLTLNLGQQPITVNLETVNLPELGIKADPNTPEILTFQFIPKIDETLITILSPTRFLINLPNVSKTNNSETELSEQWIRGDIDVKNVSFSRFEMTGNVTDELKNSTITEGEVRLGSQVMKLQKHQFLIVRSEPGIRKLRYLQIHHQSPQGLQTFISGESQGIAAGLYPDFPVQTIQPSWLSQYLSQEAISAILSFIAALTAILLPSLFPKSSE